MKTIRFLFAGLLFGMLAPAQAQVSVNVNIGSPPAWGPAGYTDVRYYYLPDIGTYYDVGTRQYIYINNGAWVRTTVLPVAYRRYNLYNGYKVVLTDYRGATPYVYYKTHKVKYPKGYKAGPQRTVGLPPGQAKKLTHNRSAAPHAKGNGHGKGHKKGKH